MRSLPSRGAWIEIPAGGGLPVGQSGRSPRGERGLKLLVGAVGLLTLRRSPRGERGLKFIPPLSGESQPGRSPRGERGLKFHRFLPAVESDRVAPLAGSVD